MNDRPASLQNQESKWQKIMNMNGAAMFVAMLVVIVLFELILQITKGGSGIKFITPGNLLAILRQQVYCRGKQPDLYVHSILKNEFEERFQKG